MERMHCSVVIEAPRERVWHTMLDEAPYREWTSVFAEGSHYEGSWEEGSEIRFLAPTEEGQGDMGMFSRIVACRPHEYVSIEHIGIIKDGVLDTESPEVKTWTPAFENYTLTEAPEGTQVEIDMDIDAEHRAMFEELWPRALQKLKTLAEAKTH